mmetsp:Transcript_33196/g.50783  ORF Transcript_33196/g.50783 Transcript_33196/m.50783 type:complete len:297 (+) Transcript_33196:137-1027(+)
MAHHQVASTPAETVAVVHPCAVLALQVQLRCGELLSTDDVVHARTARRAAGLALAEPVIPYAATVSRERPGVRTEGLSCAQDGRCGREYNSTSLSLAVASRRQVRAGGHDVTFSRPDAHMVPSFCGATPPPLSAARRIVFNSSLPMVRLMALRAAAARRQSQPTTLSGSVNSVALNYTTTKSIRQAATAQEPGAAAVAAVTSTADAARGSATLLLPPPLQTPLAAPSRTPVTLPPLLFEAPSPPPQTPAPPAAPPSSSQMPPLLPAAPPQPPSPPFAAPLPLPRIPLLYLIAPLPP